MRNRRAALMAMWTALMVLVSLPVLGSEQNPRHVRVVWHENPATEALVSWTTARTGSGSKVYYDEVSRRGDLSKYRYQATARAGNYNIGFFTVGLPAFHHGVLGELKPNTNYYFVVVTDGRVSKERWFKTAPTSGDFRLLFGGDSRSDPRQRRHMNRLIRDLVAADPGILALVHGGDFIGNGADWGQWDRWFNDHESTLGATGRVVPIVPTRGNHENSASLFNQLWGWPGNGSVYYRTDIGSLSILTLNTEISVLGDQLDWLKRQLAFLDQSGRWFVANYHRPAYPAVKGPSNAAKWVPYFEQHQVDLVFESDGHVLKRTVPIYQGRQDNERGIVYIGEGGLGVKQRTPRDYWYLKGEGFADSQHHVLKMSVTSDQMSVEAIGEDGQSILTYEKSR